jgi:hypothetical protein
VERTEYLMPRKKRAVRKAGRCPAPRQGDTPWTPGPLSLLPYVPERSSPSRVRSGKSLQTRQRFSSAAHKPRALDSSGPFRRLTNEKGKRVNANPSHSAALCGLPLVGPELHANFGVDKTS